MCEAHNRAAEACIPKKNEKRWKYPGKNANVGNQEEKVKQAAKTLQWHTSPEN